MARGSNKATFPVEKLQMELQVKKEVHAGTCMRMGWMTGKEVTKEEYAAAVKKFREGAAGRRSNA